VRTRTISTLALAGSALLLAGCTTGADTQAGGDGGGGETITVGYLPGWQDAVNNAFLLEDQLTKLGYTVELEALSEVGVLYAALAEGDVDIYPSAWPDIAQAAYVERYADDLEPLGTYYDQAKNTLAVPSYVDIDSIDELLGQSERFDGEIFTIEPGSGTATLARDSLFPEYELNTEYELVSSSLVAMAAELESAIAAERDIVVTLWTPYWINDAYDMKELEDPRGALGETETLQFMGRAGFSDEFPEAADLIGEIKLDDAQYNELEETLANEFEQGDERAAIDAWIERSSGEFDWVLTD
jgi:glycine betaine/proline transport system substrate-binding protein